MYPNWLLADVAWSFSQDIPDSPADLVVKVEQYNNAISDEAFDKTLLMAESPFNKLNVMYQYAEMRVVGGPYDDVEWVDIEKKVTIDGNCKRLTYGEILWQVHKAAYADVLDQDHHFFEGLSLLKEKDEDGLPLYDVSLGS